MKKSTLIKLLCIALMSLMVFTIVSCGGGNDTVAITFKLGGGTMEEDSYVEYTSGDMVKSLPTPTKTGVEFLGWYIGDEFTEAPFKITEDMTLTAKWSGGDDTSSDSNTNTPAGPTVTITLDPDGGSLPEGALDEFEAVIGEEIGKLPTPTRPGYDFLGWFEDGNAKWEIDKKSEVEEYDMTIIALWQAKGEEITVEFSVGVEEVLSIEDTYFDMISGEKIKDFINALPTATKSGYKFGGWQNSSTGATVTLTSTITADTVLVPIWNRILLCNDGTENHQWNAWQPASEATCTEDAKETRSCNKCGASDTNITEAALGHKFGNWATAISESGIVRSRVCVECDEREADALTNIAFEKFNTPAIDGTGWGMAKGANLINGVYTDKDIAGDGKGALTVTMEAKEATYVDIFAVTGQGSASYVVKVYYENGDFKEIGVGSFGSGDTATKAFNINATVTKFEVYMEAPSNGTDYWSELSVLIVPTNE